MKGYLSRGVAVLLALGLLAAAVIVPAQAQGSLIWVAEYFNNVTLTGAPVVTQNESSPSHNWGVDAPAVGVNADGFSARWTATMTLDGTYQVSLQADDGVRLSVDGTRYIDQWHDAAPQVYMATFTVGFGTHTIVIEYYDNMGNAFLTYGLVRMGGASTTPAVTATPVSGGGNWAAQYYNNATLAGQPLVTINEASPSHTWGTAAPMAGIPADDFSVRWASQVAMNGAYRLEVMADDGVRVFVNGVNVIDEWHSASGKAYSTTFSLPNGSYWVVIEYYEHLGDALLTYNLSRLGDYIPATQPPVNPTADPGSGGGGGVVGGATMVPIVPVYPQTPLTVTTEIALQVRANLNIRTGPGTNYQLIGRIPWGRWAQVIGRNSTMTWWYVYYNGVVGWVSGRYVILPWYADYSRVPVL